jgi:glyoxylase-like metal-dependent hydrolase (beta-lactamase superfamily II)
MPNFPNARHFFPVADLEPLRTERPELYEAQIKPLEEAGWLEPIEGFQTLAPGITTLPLPGHTPGQLGLWIEHDPPVILAADALHYPMQITHPEWCSKFDANAEDAVQSRREVIAQVFGIGALLCATHLETPGVGRIVARDGQMRWEGIAESRGQRAKSG